LRIKEQETRLTLQEHDDDDDELQTYELPEDGQELKPKHARAIFNKNNVQQVAIKYYIFPPPPTNFSTRGDP